jgi:hypothetical protein
MSGTVETVTLQREALPLLRSGLEMKKAALRFSMERYSQRLERYEQQFGIDSSTFAKQFSQGELGDEADWFEWEYILDAYRETREQLEILEQIEL